MGIWVGGGGYYETFISPPSRASKLRAQLLGLFCREFSMILKNGRGRPKNKERKKNLCVSFFFVFVGYRRNRRRHICPVLYYRRKEKKNKIGFLSVFCGRPLCYIMYTFLKLLSNVCVCVPTPQGPVSDNFEAVEGSFPSPEFSLSSSVWRKKKILFSFMFAQAAQHNGGWNQFRRRWGWRGVWGTVESYKSHLGRFVYYCSWEFPVWWW